MESCLGRQVPQTHKTLKEIQHSLMTSETMEDRMLAQMEEVMVMGCLACPKEKTLRQREKYFKGLRFLGLEDLLRYAEDVDFV